MVWWIGGEFGGGRLCDGWYLVVCCLLGILLVCVVL